MLSFAASHVIALNIVLKDLFTWNARYSVSMVSGRQWIKNALYICIYIYVNIQYLRFES